MCKPALIYFANTANKRIAFYCILLFILKFVAIMHRFHAGNVPTNSIIKKQDHVV